MAQEGSKLLMGLVDSGKKGFAEFMDYQLQEEMFKGDETELFAYVRQHAMGYGKLPERKTILKWASKHQTSIPSAEAIVEPPKFYLDKVEHRNLKLGLLRAMKDAEETRQEDPQASLDTLTSSIINLSNTHRRTKLLNFSEGGGKLVHEEYIKAEKDADTGLKFGWDTFDKMSGGLVGGDVVSIVGRPGMGKTYMALHGMVHAWHQGLVTLFVSMEMKVTPIAQRVAAMATGTSITELKSAQIASKKYNDMHKVLSSMSGAHGMWIADGALGAKVSDLQMLCSQLQPDVVFVDGAYLVRCSNPRLSRFERVNAVVEDIKQLLAEDLNVPVVQTFQFNREMTKKEIDDVGVENIAGSDAIGQLSSVVLGLFEEESIETALQRKIRVLKGRNGEQGEFTINWRFGGLGAYPKDKEGNILDKDTHNIMNFSEIIPEEVNTEMQFM